jgi:hypothetical protein
VRTVELAGRCLVVADRVPRAPRPFRSRLRLTRAGRERLRVEGSGPIHTRERASWFPEHGAPEEAVVLEQEAEPGGVILWQARF